MKFFIFFFFCCIFLFGESFIRYQSRPLILPIRFNTDIRFQRLHNPLIALYPRPSFASVSSTARYGIFSSIVSWFTGSKRKVDDDSVKDNEESSEPLTIEEKREKMELQRIHDGNMLKFEEHIKDLDDAYRSFYEQLEMPEIDTYPKPNEFKIIEYIAISLPQPYRDIYLHRKHDENDKLKNSKLRERNRGYLIHIEKLTDELYADQAFIDKYKDANERFDLELDRWSKLQYANPDMFITPPVIDNILLRTPGLEKCAIPGFGVPVHPSEKGEQVAETEEVEAEAEAEAEGETEADAKTEAEAEAESEAETKTKAKPKTKSETKKKKRKKNE
jgi:hypothetical protein